MKKNKAALVLILLTVLLLCHSDLECSTAQDSSPYGCYDVCTTFCVQYLSDARRMRRCEIKCGIECDY
ncbi:unnamed protein product [Linum trigynum]|uniref:Thionin-like protein n=1 Tax=Linum trigynum TaxID=586398 RepID=A0AAV2C9Y6_9ROSI